MKLLIFLPFAFGTRIPTFSAEYANNNFDFDDESEVLRRRRETSCNTERLKSFLNGRMEKCERFNIEHKECATWATQELQRECGRSYNCVLTDWNIEMSAWGQYFGVGSA